MFGPLFYYGGGALLLKGCDLFVIRALGLGLNLTPFSVREVFFK